MNSCSPVQGRPESRPQLEQNRVSPTPHSLAQSLLNGCAGALGLGSASAQVKAAIPQDRGRNWNWGKNILRPTFRVLRSLNRQFESQTYAHRRERGQQYIWSRSREISSRKHPRASDINGKHRGLVSSLASTICQF